MAGVEEYVNRGLIYYLNGLAVKLNVLFLSTRLIIYLLESESTGMRVGCSIRMVSL